MVSIKDEIQNLLKEHSDFIIKPLDVRDSYSDEKPVFPMILVDETINTSSQVIHGEEIYANIGYKIECYAKDSIVNDVVMTRKEVAYQLGIECDKLIMRRFGLTRISNPVFVESLEDPSVIRFINNYVGIINTKTMLIYQ